tara:strand:- start:2999 stop:3271 length:273 start_codon:yes stop_codon:yes gene_type:complete
MKLIAILTSFLILGCSSEEDKICETYADMEVKCGGYPVDQNKMTHKMAKGFCLEALGGDDMLNLGPEIECSKKIEECSAYARCEEAAETP